MTNSNFWYNFYIKYIAYGDYQREITKDISNTFGVFSKYHFISSFLGILFIVVFCKLTWKFSSKQLFKHQKRISLAMLFLEIFRMTWLKLYRPDVYVLRFDYCNQVCLFLPICILLNLKVLFPFLASVSFLGGGGVLVYPLHVFSDYAGFHIMSIQSMISHTLMVLSAINLSRMITINLKKDTLISFGCFILMLVVALIGSLVRNVNYMALLSPEGLPLINHIKAPYHIPFVAGIIMLGLYLYLLLSSKLENKIHCVDIENC